jgi:hypothetical protein
VGDDHSANPLRALVNIDLSKGIEKLVEAVDRHIGAEREGARIVKRARAEAEARVIAADSDHAIAHRANFWREAEEVRRQVNREAILLGASERLHQLPPGEISDDRVDPDWLARLFAASQDVSDDQMRALWSELLAGEVAKPGTFSIRTLDTVRVLGRSEAEHFSNLRRFLFEQRNGTPFLIWTDAIREYLVPKGIHVGVFDFLAQAGLFGHDSRFVDPKKGELQIRYFGNVYTLSLSGGDVYSLPFWFTGAVGGQLCRICAAEPDREYESRVLAEIRGKGIRVDPGPTAP